MSWIAIYGFSFFKFLFFKSSLYAKREAQTHDADIKCCMLYWMSQPGTLEAFFSFSNIFDYMMMSKNISTSSGCGIFWKGCQNQLASLSLVLAVATTVLLGRQGYEGGYLQTGFLTGVSTVGVTPESSGCSANRTAKHILFIRQAAEGRGPWTPVVYPLLQSLGNGLWVVLLLASKLQGLTLRGRRFVSDFTLGTHHLYPPPPGLSFPLIHFQMLELLRVHVVPCLFSPCGNWGTEMMYPRALVTHIAIKFNFMVLKYHLHARDSTFVLPFLTPDLRLLWAPTYTPKSWLASSSMLQA